MTKKIGKGAIGKEFNQALADEILERLGKLERIEDICKDEHMPKVRALQGWAETNPAWGEKFKQAKIAFRRRKARISVPEIEKRRVGRPTLYQPPLVADLLDRIENGTPREAIPEIAGMPALSTIYRWENEYPEFREKLARAERIGISVYVYKNVVLRSEDDSRDLLDNGEKIVPNHAAVARDRLAVDTNKWFAGTKDERFRDKNNNQQVAVLQVAQQQTTTAEPQNAVEAYEAFQKLVKGE